MLFKQAVLEGIAAGRITAAFRRWKRSTVKAGGTLHTSVGLLAIRSVEVVEPADLTDRDAHRAGFPDRAALITELERGREGPLYRITFTLAGPDPRIELRESDQLSVEDRTELAARLQRLDQRAAGGPWTHRILRLIAEHPEQSAGQLAMLCGWEKEWLKTNVRKLKNLGLTESLHPGYRLSPRGRAFLDHVRN
ncbi:MAG: hypothetical protein KF861_16120 [Planctomycetaceae bacterium]|nr:hypothetical protein [Planctomycetaceae bacterium]